MTARLTWHGPAVRAAIANGVAAGLERAGQDVVDAERKLLSRQYPPAGAPGGPPARRSGKLQDAQGYRVERTRRGAVLVIMGAKPGTEAATYARYVHARRPWLRQGVDAARGQIIAAVAAGIRSSIGRGHVG